jgi:hypothetical protein
MALSYQQTHYKEEEGKTDHMRRLVITIFHKRAILRRSHNPDSL